MNPILCVLVQHEEAIISAKEIQEYPMTSQQACQASETALKAVLAQSKHITLDHWIPYYTHFELARLYSHSNRQEEAKHHLGLILSGKSRPSHVGGQDRVGLTSGLHVINTV